MNTQVLRDVNIYEGMTDEEIVCIAKNSIDKDYGKNALIYSPYEENQNIYVIKKGEVQLYHDKNGKKVVFDVLTPGTLFGSLNPEQKKPNHFAEATKNSHFCVTPVNDFLKLVATNPEMMLRFMQKMASRLKDYEEKLEVSNGTAEDKILYELKRLKEKRSKNFFGKMFNIPLRLTHEELAALTGLNRVTVTRTLGELEKQGRVSIDSKTGVIEVNTDVM